MENNDDMQVQKIHVNKDLLVEDSRSSQTATTKDLEHRKILEHMLSFEEDVYVEIDCLHKNMDKMRTLLEEPSQGNPPTQCDLTMVDYEKIFKDNTVLLDVIE